MLNDEFVCSPDKAVGDVETECFGGLQVDGQFKFRGLYNWQISWLLALKNPAGIDTNLTIRVCIYFRTYCPTRREALW